MTPCWQTKGFLPLIVHHLLDGLPRVSIKIGKGTVFWLNLNIANAISKVVQSLRRKRQYAELKQSTLRVLISVSPTMTHFHHSMPFTFSRVNTTRLLSSAPNSGEFRKKKKKETSENTNLLSRNNCRSSQLDAVLHR
jgi:hypothetical protein